MPIPCSIGVMAYNEEENVGNLLSALISQRTECAAIREIFVVASGCTDSTLAVVRECSKKDERIRLIAQARRLGKAAAVNAFIAAAQENVLVLCSADLLPTKDTIDALVNPFGDAEIGLTAARPCPVNDPGRFAGFAAHLLWNLHHEINLVSFKAGELIAFRKVFQRIPVQTAVDEAYIEPIIRGQGYRVLYVPTAVVYNKGPETVNEFLSQRRRIYAGHLALHRAIGYKVSTLGSLRVSRIALERLDLHPRAFLWTCGVAALEAFARSLGWWDHLSSRDHSIWEVTTTTKKILPVLSARQLQNEPSATRLIANQTFEL
jgi:poly-beta-1,6-N-acetyl-D-glucosamine synthase